MGGKHTRTWVTKISDEKYDFIRIVEKITRKFGWIS